MTNAEHSLNLAKNLRKELKERELPIKDLSFSTQVPLKTIYGWLSGSPPRNLIHLKKVAATLDVSIDELAFGEQQPSPSGKALSDIPEFVSAVSEVVVLSLKNIVTHSQEVKIDILRDGLQIIFEAQLHPDDVKELLSTQMEFCNGLNAVINAMTGRWGFKSAFKVKKPEDTHI